MVVKGWCDLHDCGQTVHLKRMNFIVYKLCLNKLRRIDENYYKEKAVVGGLDYAKITESRVLSTFPSVLILSDMTFRKVLLQLNQSLLTCLLI